MKNDLLALMCFLSCLNCVRCNRHWKERNETSFRIGENITLTVQAEDNVDKVLWAKEGVTFLETSINSNSIFLNKTFILIICAHNVTSITICNATSEKVGIYTASLQHSGKYKTVAFYVKTLAEEEPVILEGLKIGWSKDNRTEIAVITYDNSSDIQLNISEGFCGETTYVKGTEGQPLLLHIKGPTSVKRTDSASIRYRDSAGIKLNMSHNGSLLIAHLTKEDQGNYTVMIERWGTPECNHTCIVTTSSYISVTINGIAIFFITLVLVIVILMIICFLKRKLWCRHRWTSGQQGNNRVNRSNRELGSQQEEPSQEMVPFNNNSPQKQRKCVNGYMRTPLSNHSHQDEEGENEEEL